MPKGLAGRFSFDGNHARAVAIATEQAAALVTNVGDDAILNARKVIVDGLQNNRSTSTIARDLGGRLKSSRRAGIIGLDGPQTDRMINLRSMLSDPDRIGEYFKDKGMKTPRYKEANRRFDGMVRKAIRDGKALNQADADRLVEAYKTKATAARAKRVAESEAFKAQTQGRDEAYAQMLERDDVEGVTKEWRRGFADDPREDHTAMDGTVIEFNETFNFPDASMKHSHDPAGGPKHNIKCSCFTFYRVRVPKG